MPIHQPNASLALQQVFTPMFCAKYYRHHSSIERAFREALNPPFYRRTGRQGFPSVSTLNSSARSRINPKNFRTRRPTAPAPPRTTRQRLPRYQTITIAVPVCWWGRVDSPPPQQVYAVLEA